MAQILEEQLTNLERERERGAVTEATYRTRREQLILALPRVPSPGLKRRAIAFVAIAAVLAVAGAAGYLLYLQSDEANRGTEIFVSVEATAGASYRGFIATDLALTEFTDSAAGEYRAPVSTGPRADIAVVQKTSTDGEVRYTVHCSGKITTGTFTADGEFEQVACR